MMARIGGGARSRQGPRQESGQAGQVYRAPTKKEPSALERGAQPGVAVSQKKERWRAPDRVPDRSRGRREKFRPPLQELTPLRPNSLQDKPLFRQNDCATRGLDFRLLLRGKMSCSAPQSRTTQR